MRTSSSSRRFWYASVALMTLLLTTSCSFIIGKIRYDEREKGSLRVGDQAPDATLVSLDDGSEVQLHDWISDKPLVLVFGSFT